MKKILIFLTAILVFLSCKDECGDNNLSIDTCDRDSLIVINDSSPDLQKFVIRNDTSSLYGFTNAIKSALDQGEIEWIGNNLISRLTSGEYYLQIPNYADSSWLGLEFWAYLRESLIIKFNPYYFEKQKIFDENSYNNSSSKNYARYFRWVDDYSDASWDIDLAEDSYIIVTKIDQNTKIAEGEFELYFKIKEQSKLPGIVYSNKVQFRCGKFKSKIFE